MAEASNATESRLSSFIQGCSQLQEIYAVTPLTYTNIMGEWWQRINDIIYALGLTETESTVVNIAWTVPEIGRKRSPFFVEELSTKKPDGTYVLESTRVSTVAGDGTGQEKAHKYGLIQSVDALFQRNINTWGDVDGLGLYEYFWNQQHTDGAKPKTLTEMIFGQTAISDAGITELYNDSTRNLTGNDKGLANSLKHVIEDIFGSDYYDWLDNLSDIEGPYGLQEFFFSDRTDFSDIFDRMTTGGVVTESVKLIDTIGLDFYNWLNSLGDPVSIQQFFFGNESNFDSVWERLTTNGLATETVKVIDTIGSDFYDWLNNGTKLCNIGSSHNVYHLYKRTSGNWARINASTEYAYKGKTTVKYTLKAPVYGASEREMLFSKTLTESTMAYADNTSSTIAIATVYGNSSINTTEKALKKEFVDYAINGTVTTQSPLSVLVPSPSANDVAFVGIRMLVNGGTDSEYELTKTALFTYNGSAWSIIEDTYGTIIPGVYEKAIYSTPTPTTTAERNAVKTCLVEVEKEVVDSNDHSPATLMDLLFGTNSENEICDIWKDVSTGSIIKENQMVKDAIGQDLLDLVNGEPICTSGDGVKAGPHSLKEMLFGSLSTDEICKSLKQLTGDSMIGEINNITSYLGDSYQQFVTNNSYTIQSSKAEEPIDPAINPLAVLATMDRGQVLYGAGLNPLTNERSYKADYIVETGYICDTMSEALDTINSLTDQERIFNTYQRIAYTGLGTPFTPGTTDTSIDTSDTIYYYNTSLPFVDFPTCRNIIEGNDIWPDPTDSTKRQYVNLSAKTEGNAALVTPNLQIYNACESRWYVLLENTVGTEACPNVKNGADVSTVSMVDIRSNPDWSPSYAANRLIKKFNQKVNVQVNGNTVVKNRRVYAISNWEFTLSANWKLKHHGVAGWNASTNKWVMYSAGNTVPSGTKVAASILFFVEREPNDAGVVETYSDSTLTKISFTKNRFTSYEFYWNMAIHPRWYNNSYYPNNEYRNHYVYIKRNFFAKSPTYLSKLGIQEEVFSNGNPIDSLSWVYDTSKKLIFMGCNSIAWTGFLSNKKFPKYHFETSANSDTDDDDGTGIIVGGYKDNETGIVHTLSLTRTYSGETSFDFRIDMGGNGGKQLFYINATNNTFCNPDFRVRHLNGRYGGYTKNGTSEFVDVVYNGTDNYIVCDPKTSASGAAPDGYYDTNYAVDKVGSTYYNITKTIYRDTYVNTGPSGGYTINFKMGDDVVYSGTTFTRTKNGRRKLDDSTNEPTTTEATNDWLDVKKVVQAVLGIVAQGGLIFARTHCAADKNLARGDITNVLDVQHVLPFHLSTTSFATWWGNIGTATKNGILNSIRYAFKKGSNANITTSEAQTILQTIYSKYTLSSLTYGKSNVDDILKMYHGGTRVYAGDPSKDCFNSSNLTTLGFIQGYGYLNAYTTANLNDKYIVDRKPGLLEITYKDLYYAVAASNSTDPGIQYLKTRHPYRGDIKITFETKVKEDPDTNTSKKIVELTVQQGNAISRATSDSSAGVAVPSASITKRTAVNGDTRVVFDIVVYNKPQNTNIAVKVKVNEVLYHVAIDASNRAVLEVPLASGIDATTVTASNCGLKVIPTSAEAANIVYYLANLTDPKLLKMLDEPTGYGYMGCSNPLTNFTNNSFIDLNTSTVYDLDTNHIWVIDEASNKYSDTQGDATAEIYKKYGPGKLISNDISEKLYYTRGDSDLVQKLVDGSLLSTSSSSSGNMSSYYNIFRNDILNEVDKKLYGSEGRAADVDADGNEIAGEAATEGVVATLSNQIDTKVDTKVATIKDALKAEIKQEMGYGSVESFNVYDLTDEQGNLINSAGVVSGDGYYTITGCTPGKMVVIGHSNPDGAATACGIRVVSGSIMGRGTHPGAYYRLGTNALWINATASDPNANPPYTSEGNWPESYTDYSMSFVIIPNSDTLVLQIIEMDDDGDILYVFK